MQIGLNTRFLVHRFCDHCQPNESASKKMNLWKLPPVLIIHFRKYAYVNGEVEKLNVPVEFPINNLIIKDNTSKENVTTYQLTAICNHYKVGKSGGYCK